MPIKRLPTFSDQIDNIKKDLAIQIRNDMNTQKVIAEIKKAITFFYLQTFQHWGESGIDGDRSQYGVERETPKVEFFPANGIVKFQKDRVIISIGSMAVNSNKQPHHIWYWLNDGTKDTLFTENSALFYPLNNQRTSQGTLTVDGFKGYQNNKTRIVAGRVRRGIEPRGWTEIIGKSSIKKLDKINIEGFIWEASYIDIPVKLNRI